LPATSSALLDSIHSFNQKRISLNNQITIFTNNFMGNFMKKSILFLFTAVLIVALGTTAMAADRYSVASGNWNATSTWSATSGGAPGASAPVAADNAIIEGGWTVTVTAAAACTNLSIATGSALTVGGFTLAVSGTTNITGTITFNSATGAKTFTGAVTLNSGAVWNETAAAAMTFANGITNNATTFTASTGVHTFSTNAQAVGGSTTTTIPSVTVTTIVLTNNGTLTANTALAGTGTLSNSSSGTLNLGGTCSVTTLTNNGIVNRSGTGTTTSTTVTNNLTFNMSGTGTVTAFTNAATGVLNLSATTVATFTTLTVSASGNTVNYTAAGNQTIKDVAYSNLGTSGSGTKTWTETAGRVMSGNLDVGNGTTLSVAGAFAWTVSGTTTIGTGTSGILSITNATGTKTFTGAVTIGAGGSFTETAAATLAFSSDVTIGGTLTLSGAAAVSITGNFTNNSTFTCATSTVTFNAAGAQSIGGSGTITFDNLTLSGSGTKTFAAAVTANGTLSIAGGVVADLGTFTSSAGMLTLGGTNQTSGSWGSSSSSATHQNDTYFAASTGIVNIAGLVDTWTGGTSTDWNTASNWDAAAVPTSSDDAVVNSGGNQPSVDATANCNNLTVNTGATVTNNSTLTVAAALSGAGTLVNSATGVLNLGGTATITTLTSTAAGNTVNYTGGAQTVKTGTYVNLGLSGTGAKTTATVTVNGVYNIGGDATVVPSALPTYGAGATIEYSKTAPYTAPTTELPATFAGTGGVIIAGTGAITVSTGGTTYNFSGGGLTINSGATLNMNRPLTVSQATTVSGTLTFGSTTTRAYTLTGDVTLNSGSTWTATAGTHTYTIAGNFTNNATTFTPSTGVHTFSGSNKTISGSTTTAIASITVSGTVTVNGTVTASTALAGAGTVSVGATGTLNVNFTGAMGLTNLATTAGSIVKYGYGGIQTVKAITYDNLTLAGSGAKTTTGITVGGVLTMAGTATASAAPIYTGSASLVYAGSALQTTGVELLTTMGRPVTINNSNGVNLNASTTLNADLTFTNGIIITGANTLTVSSGVSVTGAGAGKYVQGNLARHYGSAGTLTFDIGTANGYSPVDINATAGTFPTTTPFTVYATQGVPAGVGDPTKTLARSWTLTNGDVSTADLTFYYLAGDVNGTESNYGVARKDAGIWIELGGVDDPVNHKIPITGISTFSDWTAGEAGALPVEIASFTAKAVANNVNLEWSTVSETNTLGFYVERSNKTGSFTAVSSLIAGAGTSTAQHNYSYADNSVGSGTYYYRLHQVDKDGKGTYSNVITVTVTSVLSVGEEEGVPTVFKLQQNYPNPFNPTTDIKFWIKDAAFTTLKVYNSLGQEVASLVNGMMQPGRYVATWYANASPSGVYFYRLQSGSNVSVQRMLMLK
jgi:hypothetical protein